MPGQDWVKKKNSYPFIYNTFRAC